MSLPLVLNLIKKADIIKVPAMYLKIISILFNMFWQTEWYRNGKEREIYFNLVLHPLFGHWDLREVQV